MAHTPDKLFCIIWMKVNDQTSPDDAESYTAIYKRDVIKDLINPHDPHSWAQTIVSSRTASRTHDACLAWFLMHEAHCGQYLT